jgi:hypothetical protein
MDTNSSLLRYKAPYKNTKRDREQEAFCINMQDWGLPGIPQEFPVLEVRTFSACGPIKL